MNKIIVVWICHFTNKKVQDILNPRKRIAEFAPWISLGVEEAKKRKDIELHIVSPHLWISGVREFEDDNIFYHFFNSGIPFYGRNWPKVFKLDYFTNFYFNRKTVLKIISRINPDIINLHGIENPYYSYLIFDYLELPTLITIQGLKSLNRIETESWINKRDLRIEQKIINKFNNFGIRVNFLKEYLNERNPNAKFYWFNYFYAGVYQNNTKINKTIDCVFFARLSKDKGVEDLINAAVIVKQAIPNFSVKIIGGCNATYMEHLKNLIEFNKLEDNVELLGFLKYQKSVHKIVSESIITVLPTYNDILSGTIIESLKLGTPVIAYSANGVVDFNRKEEVIKLVEVGNTIKLADEIIRLLNDSDRRELMIIRGFKWAQRESNNAFEFEKLIKIYKEIITNKCI